MVERDLLLLEDVLHPGEDLLHLVGGEVPQEDQEIPLPGGLVVQQDVEDIHHRVVQILPVRGFSGVC